MPAPGLRDSEVTAASLSRGSRQGRQADHQPGWEVQPIDYEYIEKDGRNPKF